MAEIAKLFFGTGTAGMVMLALLLGGLVAFMGEKFLVTIGKGFYAAMFKTGMEIAAVLAVVGVAVTLLVKIFEISVGTIK